jgi:hypothetical protein
MRFESIHAGNLEDRQPKSSERSTIHTSQHSPRKCDFERCGTVSKTVVSWRVSRPSCRHGLMAQALLPEKQFQPTDDCTSATLHSVGSTEVLIGSSNSCADNFHLVEHLTKVTHSLVPWGRARFGLSCGHQMKVTSRLCVVLTAHLNHPCERPRIKLNGHDLRPPTNPQDFAMAPDSRI